MSEVTLWVVWALIGFIAGYMCGRLLEKSHLMLMVVLGVVGGIAGGWLLPALCGLSDQIAYGSLLTSVAGAALLVWVGRMIFGRSSESEE